MNASEFKKVLQGAVLGNHRDLESILELYPGYIHQDPHKPYGKKAKRRVCRSICGLRICQRQQ